MREASNALVFGVNYLNVRQLLVLTVWSGINLTRSIILLGLFVSYLPQHYRIVSRGTSEGISPWFVLLGTTSATSGFANILTVPPSRNAISCCKELETFECAAGLLGVAQLGAQWICFSLMYVVISTQLTFELVTNTVQSCPLLDFLSL